MPHASHPPVFRISRSGWYFGVAMMAALVAGLAWEMLAACGTFILVLLFRQRVFPRPEGPTPLQAGPGARPPKVSLHLAIRDAPPERLDRTLDALARLDYPDFDVLVVDSNTADPARWANAARHCAQLGARFRFFTLGAWPGGRAGALAFARAEMAPDAEVIGVLRDGDIVDTGWLRQTASAFADARLGAIAAPLRGSAADDVLLVRTAALDQAGGWVPGFDAATAELMLRLSDHGWQARRSGRPAGHTERCQAPQARAPYRFGQLLRCHSSRLLGGRHNPAVPPLAAAMWLADAAQVWAFALFLLWSVALSWSPWGVGFPAPAVLVPLLALMAVRAGLAACPSASPTPSLADAQEAGLAVWCGLLGIDAPRAVLPGYARLVLIALAVVGVAARHTYGGIWEATWFLLALAIAVPDLVAPCSRLGLRRPRRFGGAYGTGD